MVWRISVAVWSEFWSQSTSYTCKVWRTVSLSALCSKLPYSDQSIPEHLDCASCCFLWMLYWAAFKLLNSEINFPFLDIVSLQEDVLLQLVICFKGFLCVVVCCQYSCFLENVCCSLEWVLITKYKSYICMKFDEI